MMKLLFLSVLMWFSCLRVVAQHDLYKWQLKGYTGIAHYYNPDRKASDYLKTNNNLWYRLEIGRSLGNTFGLAANASFGKIRGLGPQGTAFTTEARMASARLYFYTDNGWLLKTTSFVSPFFFGGYGLSTFTMNYNGATNEIKYTQVLPFGLGLKFRLTERWQLDLRTEAVYSTKPHLNLPAGEQNKYNNSFLHTGFALAYNFGYKKSTFNAARFYVGFQDTLSRADTIQPATTPNLTKLNTRSSPLISPTDRVVNPKIIVLRDTVAVRDTIAGSERYQRQNTDTLSRQTVVVPEPDTIYTDNKSRIVDRESLTRLDTVRTTAREKAMRDRERALEEYDLRTRRATALRQAETARVQQPLRTTVPYRAAPRSTTRIYEPAPQVYGNSRVPLNAASPSSLVLLERDRRELEDANRRNRQLRYTRDSLYQIMAKDGTQMQQANRQSSSFNALDDQTQRYMREQATLNDSIRQRLAFYENELARLSQAEASSPVAAPETISSFDTNVFFRINSYEIPSQSFNNLLACAALLKANPQKKLQLTGYADRTGPPSYNQVLSRKRVESVSEFFRDQGIEKERILMQYFGETNSDNRLISLDRKVVLNIID